MYISIIFNLKHSVWHISAIFVQKIHICEGKLEKLKLASCHFGFWPYITLIMVIWPNWTQHGQKNTSIHHCTSANTICMNFTPKWLLLPKPTSLWELYHSDFFCWIILVTVLLDTGNNSTWSSKPVSWISYLHFSVHTSLDKFILTICNYSLSLLLKTSFQVNNLTCSVKEKYFKL